MLKIDKNTKLFKQVSILVLIIIITILFRLPFLGIPLDRDSAYFALLGKFHNEGFLIYKDFGNPRPPGIHLLFSVLFKFLSPTDVSINIFMFFWVMLNTFLVYMLASGLFNNFWISFVSVILYGFFANSPFINGDGALSEQFMITFSILAYFLLIQANKKQRTWLLFLSGLSFGFGFLFKQIGIFEYFSAAVYLFCCFFLKREKILGFFNKIFILSISFFLPFLLSIAYYAHKGILKEFFFGCFGFNLTYTKALGYNSGHLWNRFIRANFSIFEVSSLLWVGAAAYVYFLFRDFLKKNKSNKGILKEKTNKLILLFWSVFSFLGICVTFRFFPHYYITIIPSLVLMTSYALIRICVQVYRTKGRFIMFVLTTFLFLSLSIYSHYDYYFKLSPEEISMREYSWEPFVETKKIGSYIQRNTKPEDYIFIWGEDHEVYFYTLRKPPSFYLNSDAFAYFSSMFPNAANVLLSDLEKKQPVYLIIDIRFAGVLKRYKKLADFFRTNYILEREFKVIRNNIRGYSLLVCRLKPQVRTSSLSVP